MDREVFEAVEELGREKQRAEMREILQKARIGKLAVIADSRTGVVDEKAAHRALGALDEIEVLLGCLR